MQVFFFKNCTHILTRTQGEKFGDMFLFKIASKGTFLIEIGMKPNVSVRSGRLFSHLKKQLTFQSQ